MDKNVNDFIDNIVSKIQDLYEGWEVPLFSDEIKKILLNAMFEEEVK